MTRTEAQHRDQVPSDLLPLEIHVPHTRLLHSPRLARLLVTEGPHGRTGYRDEVGTQDTMRTRKLLANNPQRLSLQMHKPHKAWTQNIQTLSLKSLNTVQN